MNKKNENKGISECCGAEKELQPIPCPDGQIGCCVYHCQEVCAKCKKPFVMASEVPRVDNTLQRFKQGEIIEVPSSWEKDFLKLYSNTLTVGYEQGNGFGDTTEHDANYNNFISFIHEVEAAAELRGKKQAGNEIWEIIKNTDGSRGKFRSVEIIDAVKKYLSDLT